MKFLTFHVWYSVNLGSRAHPSPKNVALVVPNMLALSGVIDGLLPDATEMTKAQAAQANEIIGKELEVWAATIRHQTGLTTCDFFCFNHMRQVTGTSVKHYEKVANFRLLLEPFTVDNGLLTPKMSQKRPIIEDRYADVIADLHQDM